MELNNLKTESMKLRMTASEKAAMKSQIFGMPAQERLAPQPSSYFGAFQFLHTRVLVPAFAVVLVFGSAATAAAAQGSLPGDILYPVKVSVNEAVEVALATTPIARAEVSQKLAERRVEEAETLASQGKLDPQVGAELAANFEEHANNAATLTQEVEAQDPAAAESLRTALDSTLEAHGAILATLTEGGSKDNQEGVGTVAARVLARATPAPRMATMAFKTAKVAEPANQATTLALKVSLATDTATGTAAQNASGTVSMQNDMAEAPKPDARAHKSAEDLKARAEAELADAREQFEDNKAKLSISATQISGEFAAIEALMDLGSTTLATGHDDEAMEDYAQALKRATKLEVLLKVQVRLNQNIVGPILEKGDSDSFEVQILPAAL